VRHRVFRPGAGQEQLLIRNVKRFRGGLVFKAHRLFYHSTLGSRVIKKKKKEVGVGIDQFGGRILGRRRRRTGFDHIGI